MGFSRFSTSRWPAETWAITNWTKRKKRTDRKMIFLMAIVTFLFNPGFEAEPGALIPDPVFRMFFRASH
jgi:hypothetical protein